MLAAAFFCLSMSQKTPFSNSFLKLSACMHDTPVFYLFGFSSRESFF
jgi:hypothetical protein